MHPNYPAFDENHYLVITGSPRHPVAGNNSGLPLLCKSNIDLAVNWSVDIYLSNESNVNVNVHFDDMQVTHIKSEIVQADDYYPFGLTMAGTAYTRIGDKANKFKFQGQELQDDLGLNWYQFKYRMHDPELGRFMVVDPLSEKYYYNSPYAFSENKVTSHFELEGKEAELAIRAAMLYTEYKAETFKSFNNIRNATSNLVSGQSLKVPSSVQMNTNQRNTLNSIAKISDANKISQGVKDIGSTTAKMAAHETLNATQGIGEGIEIGGIVTGQPEVIATGKSISSVSKYANMAIDYSEGNINIEDVGYEIAKDEVSSKLSGLVDKAKDLGNLGNEAYKLTQGIIKAHEKAADQVKDLIDANKDKKK